MSRTKKRKPSAKQPADILTLESVEGAILDVLSVIDEHADTDPLVTVRARLEEAADYLRENIDEHYAKEEQ